MERMHFSRRTTEPTVNFPGRAASRRRRWAWVVLLPLLCGGAAGAQGPESDDAARELGRRVVARIGPMQRVVLEIDNQASLRAQEVARLREVLEAELASHGTRVVEAETAETFRARVTLARNLRGFLWVAEVRREGEAAVRHITLVAVESAAGAEAPGEGFALPKMSLERRLVWRQEEPILDAALMTWAPASAPWAERLVILEPRRVVVYRAREAGWELERTLTISTPRPPERDPRGMLAVEAAGLRAFLPGVECAGDAGEGAELRCGEGGEVPLRVTDGWRTAARFVPGRNFFTAPETRAAAGPLQRFPAFYSLAAVPRREDGIYLVAAVGGRVRLFDEEGQAKGEFTGWGSDIAGMSSSCGSGWQVLATSAGEDSARDSVRAYELERFTPTSVSEGVEFAGRVTALWTRERGNHATVVVRDVQTGMYEAYSLTLACN